MAASRSKGSRLSRTVRRCLMTTIVSGLFMSAGCADGPMFHMKKLSPWHQRDWRRDRELGPTYSQRLGELALLKSRIASYSPDEQQRWAGQLENIVTKDTSPEMRAQAARVLAQIDSESTIRALNAASKDDVEKVRLAVCEAWGVRNSEHARDMLLSLAQTDESDDVRQAAIAALGGFDAPEVRSLLAESLEHKNPAVQQQAVVALKKMTGRDFGGDFDAWKRYLDGEDVPEPEPVSFTARVLQSLPSIK
ncbi:MAG: HEAT repeat domain-containing protein [Pirellulaceae bacterium]|nr:HEAT repeat domain-containing protein [Pirellulaceae bacterium]